MYKKRKYPVFEVNTEEQNDEDRLKKAVRDGDEKIVRRLVKGGVRVNPKSRQWFGGTILHDAVSSGKAAIVKLLLQAEANVNAKAQDNRTALHIAARTGCVDNTEIVKELLNAGADVNIQTKDKRTALHFAAWRGNKDIVELLVSHGADVNVQDEDLWSPLYWAAKQNFIQIAKVLVGAGACLNCVNAMEMSPLHEVIEKGHVELAKYLINEGAVITGKMKGIFQLMVANKHLKTEERISLCDVLIQAGYPIRDNIYLPDILSRKPNMDPVFLKHVQNQQLEVLTLKDLCRINIRKKLIKLTEGCGIRQTINKLPIPKLLHEYLIFDR